MTTTPPTALTRETTDALSRAAEGNTDALLDQVVNASLRNASRSLQRVADIQTALGNHYLAHDAHQALAMVTELERVVSS